MRHPRTWWRGRRARRSARWPARCSRASGSAGPGSSASRPTGWSRVRAPSRTELRIRVVRGTSRAVRSRSRRSSERRSSARAPAQSRVARAPFHLGVAAQLRSSSTIRSTGALSRRHVRPGAEAPARPYPSGSLLAAMPDPARRAGGGGSSRASVRSPGACARWGGDSSGPVPGPRPADCLVAVDQVPTGLARHPGRPAQRASGLRGDRAHRRSLRLYHRRTVIIGSNPPP